MSCINAIVTASWRTDSRHRHRTGGLGFDSRDSPIKHSVANDWKSLRCFFGAVLLRPQATEIGPVTRYISRQDREFHKDLAFDLIGKIFCSTD